MDNQVAEIIVLTQEQAEEVIDALKTLIAGYKMARVSDLYDLVGLKAKFTDGHHGWKDLSTASVKRVSEGYLLELPKTELLD